MKNFVSVIANAARIQDISQPSEIGGMCAKLKCCLNYEVDEYIEADEEAAKQRGDVLQTKDGDYYHFKSDILAGTVAYSPTRILRPVQKPYLTERGA